jgi:hypothetical protein
VGIVDHLEPLTRETLLQEFSSWQLTNIKVTIPATELTQFIPSEAALWGVNFPLLFFASLLGMSAAVIPDLALNRFLLSRFFYYPPAVLLALTVIYTGLSGAFVFPSYDEDIPTNAIEWFGDTCRLRVDSSRPAGAGARASGRDSRRRRAAGGYYRIRAGQDREQWRNAREVGCRCTESPATRAKARVIGAETICRKQLLVRPAPQATKVCLCCWVLASANKRRERC